MHASKIIILINGISKFINPRGRMQDDDNEVTEV